ncbi:DEAD/DEAH box helicase [Paenibacillus filicis]|uniref:DEAD/DEAH box helicase n=1 Tax=Paenibacillus filicis TaxID=669464 RepID=A0ABU9DEK1_9BACL
MSFQLTERIIKLLCGPIAFQRGAVYVQEGRVTLRDRESEESVYEAVVRGKDSFHVSVAIGPNGDVDAGCSCPAFHEDDNYCMHVAAVLLQLQHLENEGLPPVQDRSFASSLHLEEEGGDSSRQRSGRGFASPGLGRPVADPQLAQAVLGVFAGKPVRRSGSGVLRDTRTVLDVQFTLRPFPYGKGKHMIGLELKLGPARLYTVPKLRELLEKISRLEAYAVSKHFTYDPRLHSFRGEDDGVIQQLIQILRNEQLYRETLSRYPSLDTGRSGEKLLLIPPASWSSLLNLLLKAPKVRLEQPGNAACELEVSTEPVPLVFEFAEDERSVLPGGYQLTVQGLDAVIPMEAYAVVWAKGKLLSLPEEACRRLTELKSALTASSGGMVPIPAAQMESFMDQVVPGLMKIGSVRIAKAISDRVLQVALKARLYLDRVKDRLLAGLEFQYGDIVINPLGGEGGQRGADRILMRDGEQEHRILELMELAAFSQTESGYILNDEEAEYEFLVHILPQLEKLLEVYATSAVKVRVLAPPVPPGIRVDVDERTDWLECKFEMEGIPESEIRELLLSLEDKRKYYKLPSGSLLPLETAEFQEIIRFMNAAGVRKGDISGHLIRLPVVRGLLLSDSREQGHTVTLGKSFRLLLEHMQNPDHLDFPVPDSLKGVLRDYQAYGYQWMRTLARYRFGGILADDMGLGKTLQSIAFLVSMLPEIRSQGIPAVIVSPASLLYNWQSELKKFAPELRVVIADGYPEERSTAWNQAAQVDVLITSYPLLRQDMKLYAKQTFHTLILDEAQAFKNHATQTAHAVKAIQAGYRFALTGTPIENGLEELWSIFSAVFPALFPSKQEFSELPRDTVARRIRPFLLRRLKTDVLKELPEKIESVQATELLTEQKKLYTAYLAKLQKEALKHLSDDGFQKNRIRILAGLTRLRQICCHPALFVEGYEGSSAKFEQLLEILEECRSAGKRPLIFSQFTEMLGLIRRELGYRGMTFFYLDGSTPAAERVELCNRFNGGERDLFLISLKAGGTGLNLPGADTVILYDLWWNPAVEQQAADRAHRMGQKNVVQVIRLVTQGTVEDKMYELQQRKKHLIDEVIQPGQEALSSLTEQELREILMIG